jgi:hypothetical protein
VHVPISATDRERRAAAAARYRPATVDLLLVAEAPPENPARYFYFEDVQKHDALFRETSRAVLGREPTRAKRELLTDLQKHGVFLIDLKLDPKTEPNEDLSRCVPDLVARVKAIAPRRVILIKANVFDLLFESLRQAGLPVADKRIPFPGSGQQARFREKMREALEANQSRAQSSPELLD